MDKINKSELINVVAEIKSEISSTRTRTARQVNSNLIMMYFRIGKILYEHSLDDLAFMRNVSIGIRLDFPDLKGFSERNLYNMREFYEAYMEDKVLQQLVAKISWSHNLLLLSKIKNKEVREIYVRAAIENGWSRNVLAMQIESNYHKRIGASANNFRDVLPPDDSDLVNNMVKDPYIFDFLTLREARREKELEAAMVSRLKDVLLELGKGFSFVGSQYKISVEGADYYVDLLFYHLDLRCYVAVELKVGEFKPEYTGQLGFYVTAIDELLKKDSDNRTIGLLLCREKDRLTTNWALKSSNAPIGVSSFTVDDRLPAEIQDRLPTEDELNLYLDLGESDGK